MRAVIESISAASYSRHALHDLARDWPETNCYVDLWIELLAALGLEPRAGLGFTAAQDFEGDQFTFFKFPTADLEALYGANVLELSIFDDVVGHLSVQSERGRIALVEVDGFYLPDTKGISYRHEHTKTTIGINRIDASAKYLEYFHNAGYFALSGEDFDGLFRLLPAQQAVADALFPYTEFVKIVRPPQKSLLVPALSLFARHLENRPATNPILAYKAHFAAHAEKLLAAPPAFFHKYTFNVLRQLGANHELLSAHLAWLQEQGIDGLERAIAKTAEISSTAKAMQFQLARSAARRSFGSYDVTLDRMIEAYDVAFADLDEVFGADARRLAS